MNYLGRHWRGELSLARSFWINFLPLFCIANFAERFLQPPYLRGDAVAIAAIAFFVGVRLLLHPWQVVGVLRASERAIGDSATRAWAWAAQGAVVLSVMMSLTAAFSSYQFVLGYKQKLHAKVPPLATSESYALEVTRTKSHGELIHLRGAIEIGVTGKMKKLLTENPAVRGVILDSGGGQIYEGRGLAKLIREHRLTTFVSERCESACTTAFAAGAKRVLARGAELGFHQYKNFAVLPVIDVAAEQAKDRTLFDAQGISAAFLDRIFAQPHEGMWRPSAAELIESNFVHEVGFVLQR